MEREIPPEDVLARCYRERLVRLLYRRLINITGSPSNALASSSNETDDDNGKLDTILIQMIHPNKIDLLKQRKKARTATLFATCRDFRRKSASQHYAGRSA